MVIFIYSKYFWDQFLTLILLNKLCLPHPFLTINQSDNSMLFAI